MKKLTIIRFKILIVVVLYGRLLIGQNLVPNPNFQYYSTCPVSSGQIYATSWVNPLDPVSTSDYFNVCATGSVDIPNNFIGNQNSDDGDGYVGLAGYVSGSDYREYVMVELLEPLDPGSCYYLKIIYSNADEAGYNNGLGMYLSVGAPTVFTGLVAQMELVTIVTDQDDWLEITDTYIAVGGETHLTIANFRSNLDTDFIPGTGPLGVFSYQYIDFVSVEACDSDCDAEAGEVIVDNSPVCPMETITFSVTGYNSDAGFEEYLLIVDAAGEIIEIIIGDNGGFSYSQCATFTVYSYNMEISGTATVPVIGDAIADYLCVSDCCNKDGELLVFEDDMIPVFTYIPDHPNFPGGVELKLYCIDDIPAPEQAQFDDNCIGSGFVDPVDMDQTDPCLGGTFLRTYEVKDSCNEFPALHAHIVTIEPRPLGEFIDAPEDETLDCGAFIESPGNLTYSNGLINSCASFGTVSPIVDEDYNICGGTISYIWSELDECNRTIEHIQIINITQAEIPSYIDPPENTTISCDEIPTDPPTLLISNEESGGCLIEEMVTATMEMNLNGCEGEVYMNWIYIDPCGRIINYMQTLTIEPFQKAEFVDPPESIVINCEELGSLSDILSYTNNGVGDCNISGDIVGNQLGFLDECGGEISYVWQYTDDCGREISHSQVITVNPAADPVFIDVPGDSLLACGFTTYDPLPLTYTNNVTGECSVEGNVAGTTVQAGNEIVVTWEYENPCTNETILATQMVTIPVSTIVITSVICSTDLLSYEVSIDVGVDNTISSNVGIVTDNGDGTFLVSEIPILDTLDVVSIQDITGCENEISVLPPDCNCPVVSPPTHITDFSACQDELPVLLSVFVVIESYGVWYDAPIGGTVIATNTQNYMSSDTLNPGIYTYYVAAVDLENENCESFTRTPVTLTVYDEPEVTNISMSACEDELTGISSFDLNTADEKITDTSVNTVDYFIDIADASDNINTLPSMFELSPGDDNHVYARVTNENGCYSIAEISLLMLEGPKGILEVIDESCKGLNDGSATLNLSTLLPVVTSVDGTTLLDELLYSDLMVGAYEMLVQDSIGCESIFAFEIKEGVSLSIDQFEFICSDNNTEEVLDDDYYTFTFEVNIENSGLGYEMTLNGDSIGVYNYGEVYEWTIPADGEVYTFGYKDGEITCEIEISSLPLVPCSTTCDEFPDATIFVNPSNVLDCSVQAIEVSSVEDNNTDYHWMFNSTPLSSTDLVIEEEGEVVLIAIDTITGCMSQDTLNILNLEAYPLIEIAIADTLNCIDTLVVIDGSESAVGSQYTYNWYDENGVIVTNENTNQLEVEEGGWYYLEVTDDELGCVNIDSVFIGSNGGQWELSLPEVIQYKVEGDNILLTELDLELSDIAGVEWYPSDNLSCTDCLEPEITGEGVSRYTVVITDVNGCKAKAYIDVIYEGIETTIYVPNIFNPSEEGDQQYFVISFSTKHNIQNFEMRIYSRWGDLIYKEDKLQDAPITSFWDGTYKGELLLPGVYVYMYRAIDVDGKVVVGTGDVTLTR